MKRLIRVFDLALVGLVFGCVTVRAADLTWNGSISTDWNNPTNWTPQQVPTNTDHVIINSGSVTIPANGAFAIMDWSGGTIAGALNVATNGVLNIAGNGEPILGGALTNAGTVNWLGGNPQLDNSSGQFPNAGPIVNLAGGAWNIQCDETLVGWNNSDGYPYNTNAYFLNLGLVRKTAGGGTTEIGYRGNYAVFFENAGTVEADMGTISLEGGGDIGGTFNAAGGTTIDFASGAYSSSSGAVLTGAGSIEFTGSSLTLSNDVIPGLQLLGGTVTLGPGFQGGTITNLTVAGTTLSGNYTVSGTLNWTAGTIAGSLNVASNGVLNVAGGNGNLGLCGSLTNAGTVNWLSGNPQLDNGSGQFPNAGPIVNLAGGTWNIQCDLYLGGWNSEDGYVYNTNAYFLNLGLVRKTAGSGTTVFGDYAIFFENAGTLEADMGTISLQGGGLLGGMFTATGQAIVNFAAGNFTGAGAVVNGPGTVEFTGSSLTLPNDVIPNLQLLGGTVTLGPDFQGGAITNLTVAGTTLSGNYTVSGTLNWTAGTIAGSLNVASNGVLNVAGGNGNLGLCGSLTNAGTVNWLSGNPQLDNGSGQFPNAGPIVNLAGGTWNIQCDLYLGGWNSEDGYVYNTNAYFSNLGLMRKTAGTGTTVFGDYAIFFENAGTVEADAGTISFQGGGVVGGTFNAAGGTTINFAAGNFTGAGAVVNGPGMVEFTGNSLTLSNDVIPNLQLLGGTINLGPDFQGGTITNLTLAGTTLSGNYTVSGILDWTGGTIAGALNVASNGVLNVAGGNGNLALGGTLTNAGTVNWLSGELNLDNGSLSYPNSGPIVNLAGGTWNIQCDQYLSGWNPGDGYVYNTNAYFLNLGLVRKTAGTGATIFGDYAIFFENVGAVEADAGTISFQGGGVVGGTFNAAGGTTIDFASGAFSSGSGAALTGPGAIEFTGSSLTLSNDVIPGLQLLNGTVTLGPDFQGGTITNLTLAGTTLSGNYTVSGTLNWTGGTIAGALNVASNGVLNVGGSGNLALGGTLTNAGTVNWLGGELNLDNGSLSYPNSGPIVNLAGGTWNIQCDQYLSGWNPGDGYVYNTNAYFLNLGLVRKTAGTGATIFGDYAIFFENAGALEADTGTISLQGGGSLGGTFTATGQAIVNFASGNFTGAGAVVNGPGTVEFTGNSLTLSNDVIPNLQLLGGTINLGPDFQGGTITNLTLTGSTLSGSYTVSGTLNWTAGTIAGALNVASNGVLNVVGGNGNLALGGTLTNAGTVNWLGGELNLDNGSLSYPNSGPIVNLAGGTWNIQCDQYLSGWNPGDGYVYNTNAYFLNLGLVRKTAGTGTTIFGDYAIFFENAGTLEADTGTISLQGGYSGGQSGDLAISLGGATPATDYGKISFSTPPLFDGAFSVSRRNGYLPSPGTAFQVLSYPSSTNSFTCLSGLDLGNGILLQPQFSSTGLTLLVTTYTINSSLPQLFINHTLGGVAITWPVGFPGYTLQSTTNLSSPAWATVSEACGNQAVVPATNVQEYFRLSQ